MGSGTVFLGGLSSWPYFKIDFDDPISTFDLFRSLLIVHDQSSSVDNWVALKKLLDAIVGWIVSQWEERYEPINVPSQELYSAKLREDRLTQFLDLSKCPFDSARFAIASTRAVDRTRLLDVAELKFARHRFTLPGALHNSVTRAGN